VGVAVPSPSETPDVFASPWTKEICEVWEFEASSGSEIVALPRLMLWMLVPPVVFALIVMLPCGISACP
jgi:hypothetical protein